MPPPGKRIAGGYTVLCFNSQPCWFDLPVSVPLYTKWTTYTQWIYADRLPSVCTAGVPMDLLRKFPPAIRGL